MTTSGTMDKMVGPKHAHYSEIPLYIACTSLDLIIGGHSGSDCI